MIKIKHYLYSIILLANTTLVLSQQKNKNPFSFKWNNGFKLESYDKQFRLKFGGIIMVDHAYFYQDNSLDKIFDPLTTRSGTEFRRVRLFTSGTVYDNVSFKLQLDFSGDRVSLKDVYLSIKEIPIVGSLRIGHVKEPFRLDALTSSKYITFMERALPISFIQERNNGFLLFNDFFDKKLSVQIGYFRNEDNSSDDKAANDGYAITYRNTSLLINNRDKKELLHVGVGYSYRKPESKSYKISSRPEAHLSRIKYIDTKGISSVKSVNLLNFETAFLKKSFSFQAEYLTSKVETEVANFNFSSYYGQVSYFLTGESKKFKNSYSGFDRVKPKNNYGKNGYGALEVALRYSNSNLNSKDINGGEQSDVTLGLNWYLNPSTRLMANTIFVNIKNTRPAEKITPANAKNGGKATVFQFRFQIDF